MLIETHSAYDQSTRLSKLLSVLVAVIVICSLSISFTERPIIFHDEIIATYKGQRGIIFDYASRPVFYSLCAIMTGLVGARPDSLQLLSFLSLLAACALSYLTAKCCPYLKRFAPIAPLTLAFCGWNFSLGLAGLAHMPAAVFVSAALYLIIFVSTHEERNPLTMFLIGLSCSFALLTHPTCLALIAAVGIFVSGQLLTRLCITKSLPKEQCLLIFLSLCAGMALPILITEVCYLIYAQHSFFDSWIRGVQRIVLSNPSSQKTNISPFSFYFLSIFQKDSLIIQTSLLFGILGALLVLIKQKTYSVVIHGFRLFLISVCICLLALIFLSLSSMKFDRVLVAFSPLIAFTLFSFFCGGISCLMHIQRHRLSILFVAIFISALSYSALRKIRDFQLAIPEIRPQFSNFLSSIDMIPSSTIGYIGQRENFTRAIRFVEISQKRAAPPIFLSDTPIANHPKSLRNVFRSSDINYWIVDRSVSLPSWLFQGVNKVFNIDRHSQFRNHFEIWKIEEFPIQFDINRILLAAPSRSAVFIPTQNKSLEKLIENFQLSRFHIRPAHLKGINLKHKIFAILPVKNIEPNLRLSLVETLEKHGFQLTANSRISIIDEAIYELWQIN